MCPVDTEFSSFSIRRVHYYERRDERLRNHQAHNVLTAEPQLPSPIRGPGHSSAETTLANHQDQL